MTLSHQIGNCHTLFEFLFPSAGITRIRLLLKDNKQRVCSQPMDSEQEMLNYKSNV
jgi:hypothetical protein